MLTILGHRQSQGNGVSRRRLLQVGGAGLLGLSLPRVLAAEATQPPRPARAKSVIFLFLFGGPSQLETFDMKPDAPESVRGPFRPIASRTPDLLICEHLPKVAQASDKLCVIRTMSHPYNDHSSAGHYIQTGHPWHVPIGGGFNATDKDWPAIGSVVEYLDQQQEHSGDRPLSSYVYLPNRMGHLQTYSTRLDRPGQYAGWLGRGYDAMATDIRKRDAKDNPYFRDCTDDELDFRLQGMTTELTLDRLRRRQSLLEQFDVERRRAESHRGLAAYDRLQQRAFALVTSAQMRAALDIRQEPGQLRDRYGRNLFGQSTLMARRMIEAGARFVTVGWDAVDGYSWDSHTHSDDVQRHLLPGLDRALSTLLIDLEDRGLLDETLVVCLGEMGRTPKANARWGRNHWSTLFPAVLAGAGVRGGMLYGRSDKDAAFPLEHVVRPEDLAATIYHALGINPELRIPDPQGRLVPLVDDGRPLRGLFSST
ncbi:MAG: DUF1501 domain-containing protein [Planctomycetes bacterium]|nr:DUF1501 domain-containing protein [Planctomycetota bacterium]